MKKLFLGFATVSIILTACEKEEQTVGITEDIASTSNENKFVPNEERPDESIRE